MDYWFKSYDESAYFYAISGTVTPKCIAGVVFNETNGSPKLIADGDVRSEMAATWVAYRRQSDYPNSPWGSGTINQFWYNSTYDVTYAQIPQTLNRQPYSSNVHLIADISIELVLSKAREYFDHYVPGQGVGVVTLQTDPPSQLLTFTSQKLGQSFKYWIRGNQTIELWKPEEHENEVLWIFKDGQFTDAVKDGFDISQFRSSLARPEGDINALSEWFLTAYALLQGALYGEPFYIENGYLRKSGNTGSSTSSTGRPVGETNTNFYIPIKRVTGFTKIVYEGITIQNNGTSGGEDYNIISVKAAMVNGSNAFVKSQASGGGVSQDNWATYEYSISDLDHVDYINLFGCDGSPAYRNIRLVKPYTPPRSGLEVAVYDRTWQWPAGNRPWGEQIATYTREASAYVGGIFYYQYGTIDSDTRYYTAAGNSRHMAATDGVNLSSGAALNPQETTITAEDSIWLQNYYGSLSLTLKYTVVRFKGITEWYKTHSQSGWIYTTLINVGDVMLSDPGIYVLFANINIQGDYEETFLEVVDAEGSQISSDCIFDSAGYQNVSMFSIFEISEAQQLSFHAKCSNSRGYSFSAYFVKIVSGSLSKSTFSATITSTLSQVGSIQLSPGSYLIEIDSSFNNASMKYYQELRKGNTVIIKDSAYAGTVYATTINACCYVELLATTTLTLYAKCDANSASLSGFIRALRVVDTGS